jgi:hypothetical protein
MQDRGDNQALTGPVIALRPAQALYRRLGLTEVTRSGGRGTRITMRSARHRG